MKILAIRIKNLASLVDTTEIDFTVEPLCSVGIFAITGRTGAGKSTILDALCLALYARTPRYDNSSDPNQSIQDIYGNTITQSDPRKILRDGVAEGYAEVDFVGVDGHRYRAQWSVRRARNKPEGALQSYQITCRDLDANVDVQGTKTEILASITRKVGLTFDQFTRSVLLAQGDFTAFLKAPNSEKSELLEKLTGTQVYSEISKRIFDRHRIEKEELNVLRIQKEGISILSDEDLEALNKRNIELINQLQDQQKNEETLAKELAWHEKLNTFQNAYAESVQALELVSAQKKANADREIKLTQVEQVQPARVWVQSLASQRHLFMDKGAKHKRFEEELLLLKEQEKTQNEALSAARQNLDFKIKEQEQAQPLLNQAKQLDTQLKDREKQRKTAEAELQQAKESFKGQEKQIIILKQQAGQLQQTVEKLTDYATQHQNRKSLAENDKLILTALADAQAILQEEHQELENTRGAEQIIAAKQEEEKTQSETHARVKESVQTLSTAYTQLQAAVSAIDISALQKSKSEVNDQVMEIIQASAKWKTLFDAITLYEKDKVALEKSKNELEDNRQKLENSIKESETSQTRKEAAYLSLEIARQESTENVVSLRQQLIEDQPCPVCGSKEHPYAAHDPRLDKVLTELEANLKQQESTHNQALIMQSALQEKVKQLEKEISKLSAEEVLKEREIKVSRENWNHFSLQGEAENRPAEEVAGWLNQQLARHQDQQRRLQKQHEHWQQQYLELDEHKKRHEDAVGHYSIVENTLKDIRRDIESQKERLEKSKKDLNKAIQKLVQTKNSLTPYFTNNDWFDHWKANADAFTQRITQFSVEWKANMATLDKTRQEHEVLSATIKGEENKLQLLTTEVSKKEEAVFGLTSQYQMLHEERKQLFDGRTTDEVEQQLKTAIDKAREELDEHKAKQELLQNNITRTTTQRDETQQELQRLAGEIMELDYKITHWLETYNARHTPPLAREEMETLMLVPDAWIETERTTLQQINDALLRSQTVLNEHKTTLEKHREQSLSEREMETVAELLISARASLQKTTREDAEVKLHLRQDTDNRERSNALLEQIASKAKVVDNWAQLNLVIGSADGKKFRQIAQEYTLDVLLRYTNVQLDMLSKRYILQRIPASLGLQVVDQDMGNEVRPVNSLSGGESFLVSLALALGLASLSSSRMQVESLFIDEGFGSLDPNTLNIAMDALERLHNQGRKVGVISHVQEMTERIPVQIKVSKQQSGKSKVEMVGV